jgi:toxin ParE1/3/4
MAKFYLTNKAVDDLTSIWNYTFLNWSEQQADKYYGKLIDTCQEIAKNQEFGKNYEGIIPALYGLRAKRHIVFYRLISKDEVEIIRILHESMDLKKRLNN